MDDFDNPDQSPGSDEPTPVEISFDDDANVDPRTIGKAKYVPWVAILLGVHGVLMFLAGFGVIGVMIFVAPQMEMQIEKQQEQQRQQNPNAPQMGKEALTTMLYTMYGAMSAVLFLIGIVNIYAGFRNFGYHNRTLGIVSMVLNMGSILFCWRLPLSVGLLIFGMIIYLSPEAVQAFEWRSKSRDSIAPAQ